MAAGRVVQGCDVCGKSDTQPRHHIYSPPAGDSCRHWSCCADAGCVVCRDTLAAVPPEYRNGDALTDYLTATLEG